MIDRGHISGALGTRGLEASDRKRRGGDADGDGDDFEAEFALTEILRRSQACRLAGNDSEDLELAAQVEGFVDDFFVDNNGSETYYELKSSPSQSWTKPLRANFLRQLKILRVNGLRATLVLVVSSADIAERMMDNAQRGLRSVVVRSFRTDWPWIRRSVRRFSGRLGTEDEITGLIYMLIGVWRGRHPVRSLSNILEQWRNVSGGRVGELSDPGVSEELREFFDAIIDMTFDPDVSPIPYIHHDIIGDCAGNIPIEPGSDEWENFEHVLLNSSARCYLDFRLTLIEFLQSKAHRDELIR